MAHPIIILSFNRPHYLRRVLVSLLNQAGNPMADRQVFLFQDGSESPYTGAVRAPQAVIDENVALFTELFPYGHAMPAPHNLGIAMNFDRAERFVFDELRAEAAIFLEDDMTLGRHYLSALEQMLGWAQDNPRIGYVTAYGKHRMTGEQQAAQRRRTGIMSQNWAFGTTRRQWLAQRPYVLQYLALLAERDYSARPHALIADLFTGWGLGVPGTSQDIAKSHAAILTGASKVSTVACFGRYIGAEGVHFTPEQFAAQGYAGSFVMDEAPDLEPPTDDELSDYLRTARRSAMVTIKLA